MVDFSTSKPFQSEGKEVRNCIVRGYFELAKTIPKLVGYYTIKKALP